MLEALRRGTGSFLAKIFIFLLVASFAVWGVADIFRTRTATTVAEVGETEVTVEAYRQALRDEIQSISRRSGTYLTMEQARQIGLDSQVLGRLMAEAALEDEASRRNLRVPDAVVAESIRTEQAFQTPGGQFDRGAFDQYLRATGYSEGAFVARQRQLLQRRAIGEAVGGAATAPETMAAAFHRYINETRSAEFVVVSPEALGPVEEPDESVLREFYEARQAEFTAPEYRTVSLIEVTPEAVADTIEVSQEDIEAEFAARRGEFTVAERRSIEQISFDSSEAAEAAYTEITSGERTFGEVAEARGLSEQDIDLGTLTREQVVDPAVAEAAFALGEGEVSAPVEGRFSTVLLRITAVEAGHEPSLEEIAPQVRESVATARARDEILDVYDNIEDDRASGMTLQEIAETRGLEHRQVVVDQAGRSPEGEQIALPQANDLLAGVFETDIGIETDPIQVGDDGYVWYGVTEIAPSRQLDFEEARDAVAAAWVAEQQGTQVEERADELVARIEEGASLEDVAQELGTSVLSLGPVRRTQDSGDFGQAALGLMFTTPRGEVAQTTGANPAQRVIFRVTSVGVPEFEAQPDGPVSQQLQSAIANDLIGQYIDGLEAELGSRVNQEGLRIALGEQAS
ncbi:peptidylprolyl isomerase [Lutibaculum baratangense]|uniref:Parvulin-like PPIase n=1 Tax=Lutibaculum baratangense AMV1 TaxID=631454 RepID=V4QUS7_9HYPH|nr:peptidylprolyl isomerase [Lutibaculum baratangense]ESR23492.1 hypothetical protein N177_3560 [Lutibaculum baratangense AMV1]